MLDLTFQQVQKYERGANRMSASTLVRIAAKLETTVGTLMGEDAEDRQSHDTYAKLSMPGALELIDAFAKLPNAETRRAVVALVRTLAPEPPDNDAA